MCKCVRNIFSRLFAHLPAVVTVLLVSLLASSCADEVYSSGMKGPDGERLYGPFTIEVPLCAEANESKTRATFDKNIQITKAWVGVFEVETGRLIGSMSKDFNEDPVNGEHNQDAGVTVELGNLYFNDDYPKVYIAGVANYNDVWLYGEERTLKDALDSVKNIRDYQRIAVSTASAEAAIKDNNRPLMAGFMGNGGHGNFTVNKDGKVISNNNTTAEIKLFNTTTKKAEDIKKWNENGGTQKYYIHLRRTYSHVSVKVKVDTEVFTKFENPTIQIYNVPKAVFVQENTIVEDATPYDADSWKDVTPAASDLFEGGYYSMEEPLGVDKALPENEAGFSVGENVLVRTEDGNHSVFSFDYWHYENKHWGLPSVNTQSGREKYYGTSASGVFQSLCPSQVLDFNNGATYFVLRADVETEAYSGKVEFRIHEGFCCQPNGDAGTFPNTARDFATFRNTNYTYTVNINGINDIVLNASTEGGGGAGGELWSQKVKEVSVGSSDVERTIHLPEGKLVWCINDGNGGLWGKSLEKLQGSEYYEKYSSAYPINISGEIDTRNEFYQAITVNGKSLEEFSLEDNGSEASVTLTISSSKIAEGTNYALYLCAIDASDDGTATLYTVYCFTRNGVTKLAVEMGSNKEKIIAGIDDHTLYWMPVQDAEKYKIAFSGGFETTLAPGEYYDDTKNNYRTYLKRESNGRLSFRVPYSASQNGIMNLFGTKNETEATFTVTALDKDENIVSDPVIITKEIVNPDWNFSNIEWQEAVNNTLGKPTGLFEKWQEMMVNGLTVVPGDPTPPNDPTKLYQLEYASGGQYYYFQPRGEGSREMRAFKFHACAKGRLFIYTAANTSTIPQNGGDRYVIVDFNGTTKQAVANNVQKGTLDNRKEITGVDPDLDTDGDNVYIYSSADIVFYRITFTPQDR